MTTELIRPCCVRAVRERESGQELTKHGNSLALVIDRAILDLLKIGTDTPLDISTDGEVLIVAPVRDDTHQEKFRQALKAANRKYGRALRRLAD